MTCPVGRTSHHMLNPEMTGVLPLIDQNAGMSALSVTRDQLAFPPFVLSCYQWVRDHMYFSPPRCIHDPPENCHLTVKIFLKT